MYDVIIVGGSFAGLAVADQLRGYRVLVIDRKPIGLGQTSACGTILQVLRYWDLLDSLCQTQEGFILHMARRDIQVQSPYLWCTFDYERLCRTLFERSGAEFVQALARGYDGVEVQTNRGNYRGRYVVDASGWRAVLATAAALGYGRGAGANLGIETICPLPRRHALEREMLHFWYDRQVLPAGMAWAFPRGDRISVGVGSYRGVGHLREPLLQFVRRLGLQSSSIHGTYFPYVLRAPRVGNLFVVGDAAGQCIGLSGEGIRSAMYFGEFCGSILRQVLEGQLGLNAALAAYEEGVLARRRFFRFFQWAETVLTRLPYAWVEWFARMVARDGRRERVFERYWRLTGAWGTASTRMVAVVAGNERERDGAGA